MPTKENHRLNIELDPRQNARLQEATGKLNETQVGVVRESIRLFWRAIEAAEAGGRLAVIGRDGTKEYLGGPWDDLRRTG